MSDIGLVFGLFWAFYTVLGTPNVVSFPFLVNFCELFLSEFSGHIFIFVKFLVNF